MIYIYNEIITLSPDFLRFLLVTLVSSTCHLFHWRRHGYGDRLSRRAGPIKINSDGFEGSAKSSTMSADGRDSVLRIRKEAILRRPQPHKMYECHKSSPPLHTFEPFLNATGTASGSLLRVCTHQALAKISLRAHTRPSKRVYVFY